MSSRSHAPRLLLGAACAALVLTLAGCSGSVDQDRIRSSEGSIRGLTVTGVPGVAPVVRMAPPLEIDEVREETVVDGSGPPVVVDQLFVLQLTLYDAVSGEKAISTYDKGQVAMAVKDTDGTLFPALSSALVGARQGSRVVLTLPAEDAYGSSGAPQFGIEPDHALVVIADVVSVPPASSLPAAEGKDVPEKIGQPRLVLRDGTPYGLRFVGAAKPRKLLVRTLVAGDGPPVRDDSLVTLHALGQVWGRPDPFDDSYPKEPLLVAVGTGQVVRAWDEALVGVPQGSRLLVIAPPAYAFGAEGNPPAVPGGATIAYVIDVLGVS